MALITADRVKDSTTTTGTGSITLSGTAATGFRTFASVMATNDTCYYCISSPGGSEWEVGLGTLTASTTLARTTVLASSNSGSAVSFSAGSKDVYITVPAGSSSPPLIDLPLNTLTDWTTVSGTWTAGSTIELTNPGATEVMLRYGGKQIAWASVVVQVEFRVNSVSGSLQRASLGIGRPNAGGNGWPNVEFQSQDSGTTWKIQVDSYGNYGVGPVTIPGATGVGTWRTMRVVSSAGINYVYMDGVYIMATSGVLPTYFDSHLVLSGMNTDSEFRNLKVWDMSTTGLKAI